MVTLDLSRVDRKAQGPLEPMSYLFPWSYFKPHTKPQLEWLKKLAQLDNQLEGEKHTEFCKTMKWLVCECWTLSYSPLNTFI